MGVLAEGESFLTRRGGEALRGGGGAWSVFGGAESVVGGAIVLSILGRLVSGEVGREGGSCVFVGGGVLIICVEWEKQETNIRGARSPRGDFDGPRAGNLSEISQSRRFVWRQEMDLRR